MKQIARKQKNFENCSWLKIEFKKSIKTFECDNQMNMSDLGLQKFGSYVVILCFYIFVFTTMFFRQITDGYENMLKDVSFEKGMNSKKSISISTGKAVES